MSGGGREVDARIATEVMKGRILTVAEMKADAESVWKEQPSVRHFLIGFTCNPGEEPVQVFKPYSTSIEAAWEVVEKMRELGWLISLDGIAVSTQETVVKFISKDDRIGWDCRAKTAPLAICLAALKAVSP